MKALMADESLDETIEQLPGLVKADGDPASWFDGSLLPGTAQ